MSTRPFRPGTTRRELLKLSPALLLGAFALPAFQDRLLEAGVRASDTASSWLFRRNHAPPTFSDADVVPFDRFPYNYFDVADPEVDLNGWALIVGGAVERPGRYRLHQIRALPQVRQNTRHICVEGWDVIGRFGGVRIGDFLDLVGADPNARFITVTCADRYYESLDMATAWHPQSLLCHKPAQLSVLGAPLGGYHNARVVHFLAMCGLVAFIPGHLIMVAIHGWDNFRSIWTGWKRHPGYTTAQSVQITDGETGGS